MPFGSLRSAFALIAALPLLGACAGYGPGSSDGDGPPGNGWYRELPAQGSLWEQPAPQQAPRYPPPEVSPPSFETPANNNTRAYRKPPPATPTPPYEPPANSGGSFWPHWFGSNNEAAQQTPPPIQIAPQEEPTPAPPETPAPPSADDCVGWWRICHFL